MDFEEFGIYRRAAVRYWERRRVAWNGLIGVCAVFSYWLEHQSYGRLLSTTEVFPTSGYIGALCQFLMAALAANVCYSFAYVPEFLMADSRAQAGWLNGGRKAVFVVGCVVGMGLAFPSGCSICIIQFQGTSGSSAYHFAP